MFPWTSPCSRSRPRSRPGSFALNGLPSRAGNFSVPPCVPIPEPMRIQSCSANSRMVVALRLALLAGLSLPAAARAQDAHKIVEQYVKATGGSKALSHVRTMTLQGTATVEGAQEGMTGTFTLETKLPNRYYFEVVNGDKGVIEAYNGKSAWRERRPGPPETLLGDEGAEMEAAAQIANSRLLDLKKNKLQVAYAGTAPVRGRDAVQLEVVTASGVRRQVYFDAQSHLLVKESATVGGVNREILYSDYRAEAGI